MQYKWVYTILGCPTAAPLWAQRQLHHYEESKPSWKTRLRWQLFVCLNISRSTLVLFFAVHWLRFDPSSRGLFTVSFVQNSTGGESMNRVRLAHSAWCAGHNAHSPSPTECWGDAACSYTCAQHTRVRQQIHELLGYNRWKESKGMEILYIYNIYECSSVHRPGSSRTWCSSGPPLIWDTLVLAARFHRYTHRTKA